MITDTRLVAHRHGPRTRQPKQLLLALLGEHVVDRDVSSLSAAAVIEVLEGAGVAAPATRAMLDQLVRRGTLTRERRRRGILFSLTVEGAALLREVTERARGKRPFEPRGAGWTLVTFTVREDRRDLRHRLRSALASSGFAPLRDGIWLAPGEVDLDSALHFVRADLPAAAITAFLASEISDYGLAQKVRAAWDIETIRAEHVAFIDTWSDPSTSTDAGSPLSAEAMLIADWLTLLAADPRLPRTFLDDQWPADRSFEVYWKARTSLEAASTAQLAAFSARLTA